MDRDLTYKDGMDGHEHWIPLDIALEALQSGNMRLYVDSRAISGIHIAPGDNVYFQPVVKISG